MYIIEEVKLGCTIDNYETPNQLVKKHSFPILKEAKKFLRTSLKTGYENIHGNYYNKTNHTELQTNF